jgi:hypothetical protein
VFNSIVTQIISLKREVREAERLGRLGPQNEESIILSITKAVDINFQQFFCNSDNYASDFHIFCAICKWNKSLYNRKWQIRKKKYE